MKESFQMNATSFDELVHIFNRVNSTDLSRHYFYMIHVDGDEIEVVKVGKSINKGKQKRMSVQSTDPNGKYLQLIEEMGLTVSSVTHIKELLNKIDCSTIRTVDYKYFDMEIYQNNKNDHSFLHLKDSVGKSKFKTVSNDGIGLRFVIL